MNNKQLPILGPFRTAAEIEKEVHPTRFQKFINWWKDEEHYIPFVVITVVVSLFGSMIAYIVVDEYNNDLTNKSVKEHGVSVCQKDYYVKTEYPAVGLTKIVCLSASGEEKNVFEETNK